MKTLITSLIAVILAAATCGAQSGSLILSGTVEMKMNRMLSMGGSPAPVPAQIYPPFDLRNGYPYVELMIQRTTCPPCEGCCCEWEAGSSFPFHVSLTDFDSTDFSLPLELSDPAKFLAIGFTPGLSEYPHVGGLSKSGRFLVLRGDDHRYSLVKILDIVLDDTVSVIPMTKCPSALRLYWQKQLNNQPFFEVSSTVGMAGLRRRVTGKYGYGYSIDGRRAQPPGAGTPRRIGRTVLPAAPGR